MAERTAEEREKQRGEKRTVRMGERKEYRMQKVGQKERAKRRHLLLEPDILHSHHQTEQQEKAQ